MKTKLWGMMAVLAGVIVTLPLTVYAGHGGPMGGNGRTEAGGPMGGSMGPTNWTGVRTSTGPTNANLGTDWACSHDCRDNASTCRQTAHEDGRLCAQTNCAEQTQQVSDTCGNDPGSFDCRQARTNLRECTLTCLHDGVAGLQECRTEEVSCLRDCPPSAGLGHKDPACVDTCRESLSECLAAAYDNATTCRTECAELVNTANEICEADPTSDDCEQAEREAHACLAPCQDTLQAERRACIRGAQDCVAACPDITPTSTTGQ